MSNYYSLKNIKKKNATYNLIIGERSNGKTYACLKESIIQFMDNGGQVAYVRRWKEDLTGKRARAIYSSLAENGEIEKLTDGKYVDVHYRNGRFHLCNYDEEGKAIYNEDDCLGYTFALSDSEHDKSTSYPRITTIIFDEFLTKHLYLNDEFVIFMNVISTIVRKRDNVKIYMLGNTVSKYSPYFREMGLTHVQQMEQGTIDVYRYGNSKLTVAVEFAESTEHTKKNNFYFAFNNPKLAMITGGAWELDIYPHLPMKYKPKDVQFRYFIDFNDRLYQCEIILIDDITFTYIHEKTTELKYPESDLIYSMDYNPRMNYSRNILRPTTALQERILWYYKTDRVFYQDNAVGDEISNFIRITRG